MNTKFNAVRVKPLNESRPHLKIARGIFSSLNIPDYADIYRATDGKRNVYYCAIFFEDREETPDLSKEPDFVHHIKYSQFKSIEHDR